MILRCSTFRTILLKSSRRHSSTKASISLEEWINTITSARPTFHHDTLDAHRAGQLLRTLPTRQQERSINVQSGDVLGCGHHMIYFQPETMLRDLGQDGSSPEYNAPPPYTRRMWAGGIIRFPTPRSSSASPTDKEIRVLRIGNRVVEKRSIEKVEPKKGMVFVHQKREVFNASLVDQSELESEFDQGEKWGIQEIRTHVFRPVAPASIPSPLTNTDPSSPPSASTSALDATTTSDSDLSPAASTLASTTLSTSALAIQFQYTPSTPLLFRYSALTFNAHKIHYDAPHSTSPNGEAQPGILVHGPLSATLLLELASKFASDFDSRNDNGKMKMGLGVVEFRYRAVGPIVVDREVDMKGWVVTGIDRTGPGAGGVELELTAEQGGKVCMKATAILA